MTTPLKHADDHVRDLRAQLHTVTQILTDVVAAAQVTGRPASAVLTSTYVVEALAAATALAAKPPPDLEDEITALRARVDNAAAILQQAPDLNLADYSADDVRRLVVALGSAWHLLTAGRYPESAVTASEREAPLNAPTP